VLNLTQRDYAYMRGGPGFHGTLSNVDVSSDSSIDHINIDKSPRLHTRVVTEVLAVVGKHNKLGVPSAAPPQAAPAKNGTQPPLQTISLLPGPCAICKPPNHAMCRLAKAGGPRVALQLSTERRPQAALSGLVCCFAATLMRILLRID
jgi:hypothetical protein